MLTSILACKYSFRYSGIHVPPGKGMGALADIQHLGIRIYLLLLRFNVITPHIFPATLHGMDG